MYTSNGVHLSKFQKVIRDNIKYEIQISVKVLIIIPACVLVHCSFQPSANHKLNLKSFF
jgi:hypothetical protein